MTSLIVGALASVYCGTIGGHIASHVGALSSAAASDAISVSAPKLALVKIFPDERVTFRATHLARANRSGPIAPQVIFAFSHGPTVEGIATSSCSVVADEMVKVQPIRDRADFPLVADTVDQIHSARNSDHAVFAATPSALPNIATVGIGDPSNLCGPLTLVRGVEWNKNADHFVRRLTTMLDRSLLRGFPSTWWMNGFPTLRSLYSERRDKYSSIARRTTSATGAPVTCASLLSAASCGTVIDTCKRCGVCMPTRYNTAQCNTRAQTAAMTAVVYFATERYRTR